MNKKAILQYLNCFGQVDEKTNECIVEVQQYAHFKVVHQNFSLTHGPIGIQELDLSFCSNDLEFYMKECQTCLVIACTLGIQIDRQIKYYEHIDMAKAVVFDASITCFTAICSSPSSSNDVGRRIRGRRCGICIA